MFNTSNCALAKKTKWDQKHEYRLPDELRENPDGKEETTEEESVSQGFPFKSKLLTYDPYHLEDYFDPIQFRAHHICEYDHTIKKLNILLSQNGTLNEHNLEELVMGDIPRITDLACHAMNHQLFFDSVGPSVLKWPRGKLAAAFDEDFGSFQRWKELFKEEAMKLFGSGWVFVSVDPDDHLNIVVTENGGNPLQIGQRPLMVLDMWEHAYYHDYKNDKAKYIDGFLMSINWAELELGYEAILSRNAETADESLPH